MMIAFRTANLKDDCTRECPAIDAALSLPGSKVVEMLERVTRERGYRNWKTIKKKRKSNCNGRSVNVVANVVPA